MEVVDRLFEFMAANGLSQNEFEKRCGLPHSNLKGMKQGPTSAYLVRIATAFPGLNFNWLICGTGSMRVETESKPSPSPAVTIGSIQTVNIGNWGELVELLKGQCK